VRITEEELKTLQGTKLNSVVMQLKAESAAIESGRASAEARTMELEYENVLLRIYINYGLSNKHIIDETTGEVKLKEEENDTTDENTDIQDD
jgi:hypothetical protein